MRLAKLLLLESLLAGCGESHRAPASELGWQAALARLESTTSLFSLSYYAAPPEGTTLRVALHDDSASDACAYYEAEAQAQLPEFWFLALSLSHPTEGTYRVVPDIAGSGAEQQVSARLSRVVDGKKARSYAASGGMLVLESAPRDLTEWRSGTNLVGALDLNFPSLPLHQVECRGEANVKTGESSYECTCTDDAGILTICRTDDGHDCCIGTGNPIAFHANLEATQCPWMCIASNASLYRHCLEIQE